MTQRDDSLPFLLLALGWPILARKFIKSLPLFFQVHPVLSVHLVNCISPLRLLEPTAFYRGRDPLLSGRVLSAPSLRLTGRDPPPLVRLHPSSLVHFSFLLQFKTFQKSDMDFMHANRNPNDPRFYIARNYWLRCSVSTFGALIQFFSRLSPIS